MAPIQYNSNNFLIAANELTSIIKFSSIDHTHISILLELKDGGGLDEFYISGSLAKDPWFKFVSADDFFDETSNNFLKYFNRTPASLTTTDSKLFVGVHCPYFNNFRVDCKFTQNSTVNIEVYCK